MLLIARHPALFEGGRSFVEVPSQIPLWIHAVRDVCSYSKISPQAEERVEATTEELSR